MCPITSFKCMIQKDNLPINCARLVFLLIAVLGLASGGIWASIGIAGAIMLGLSVWRAEGAIPVPDRKALLFVGLVLFLALVSVLSAVDKSLAAYSTFKLASVLIPLIILSSSAVQRRVFPVVEQAPVMALFVIIAAYWLSLHLLDLITTFGPDAGEVTKLNRGFSYTLMLAWPFFAALFYSGVQDFRRLALIACVGGILLFCLFLTHSRATQMGIVLAFSAFVGALIVPRLVTIALAISTLVFLGWSFWIQYLYLNEYDLFARLPDSWFHRVEIWDYLSYRIQESPFLGYGIGNAHKLDWLIPHGGFYVSVNVQAAHPHNAIVQLWSELGVGGLLIYAYLSFWALWGAWRLPKPLRPYALACYTFVVCLLLCAYNFWTDSLWSAMALTGFGFALLGRAKLSHS